MAKESSELAAHLRNPNRELAIRYSLELAESLSISTIVATVGNDVGWDDSALCDEFIERWVERLPPLEKLAAAHACMSHYDLALVDTPNAGNRALRRVLECAAGALGKLNETFGMLASWYGDNPDYDLDTEQFQLLAQEAAGPSEQIAAVLRKWAEVDGWPVRGH